MENDFFKKRKLVFDLKCQSLRSLADWKTSQKLWTGINLWIKTFIEYFLLSVLYSLLPLIFINWENGSRNRFILVSQ